MKNLEKRIERLEERADAQSEIMPVFQVLFVNSAGEVEFELTLGPGGTQEWKKPER